DLIMPFRKGEDCGAGIGFFRPDVRPLLPEPQKNAHNINNLGVLGGPMSSLRLISHFAAFSAGALLLVNSLAAQTSRGTVTGLITDTQKSAVPNAKVDLTS